MQSEYLNNLKLLDKKASSKLSLLLNYSLNKSSSTDLNNFVISEHKIKYLLSFKLQLGDAITFFLNMIHSCRNIGLPSDFDKSIPALEYFIKDSFEIPKTSFKKITLFSSLSFITSLYKYLNNLLRHLNEQ